MIALSLSLSLSHSLFLTLSLLSSTVPVLLVGAYKLKSNTECASKLESKGSLKCPKIDIKIQLWASDILKVGWSRGTFNEGLAAQSYSTLICDDTTVEDIKTTIENNLLPSFRIGSKGELEDWLNKTGSDGEPWHEGSSPIEPSHEKLITDHIAREGRPLVWTDVEFVVIRNRAYDKYPPYTLYAMATQVTNGVYSKVVQRDSEKNGPGVLKKDGKVGHGPLTADEYLVVGLLKENMFVSNERSDDGWWQEMVVDAAVFADSGTSPSASTESRDLNSETMNFLQATHEDFKIAATPSSFGSSSGADFQAAVNKDEATRYSK